MAGERAHTGHRGSSDAARPGDVIEHEDHPWIRRVSIGPHPDRKESKAYRKARAKMREVAGSAPSVYFGDAPYEDHHGGGLWLKDSDGWFLVQNLAGMEWSSQFCADPAKVDLLRGNAARLYRAFPEAVEELDIAELLATPITDADGIEQWVDSICNASIPLAHENHSGTLPDVAGVHHYPTPVTDIQFFKRDDFPLWVEDGEGGKVAVVPTGRRGSGDAEVKVLAHETVVDDPTGGEPDAGQALAQVEPDVARGAVLPGDHPIAVRAFARQERALATGDVAHDDPMRRLVR